MGGLILSIFTSLLGGIFNVGKAAIDGSVITTTAALKYGSAVTVAAMSHSTFWVAWGMAAISMSAWFAWGMLDTLSNGALPDVAAIPTGLEPYAQIVWANIFYIGGGVATIQSGFNLLGKLFGRT